MSAAVEPATAAVRPAPMFRPGRPSFVGAVRSELLKVRRHSLTWVLLAGIVLVTGLVLGLFLFSGSPRDLLRANPTALYYAYLSSVEQVCTITIGIFLLIVTARLVSMEYGSGTIRIVLARGTGRLSLLAAQVLATLLVGLALVVAFALVAAAVLYAAVVAWHGSFAPITSLPQAAWHDTWANVLMAVLSVVVCVLLATAAAVVGRSVAFGVGAAMAFFPTDNFGTVVLQLIFRLTNQDLWRQITAYLLGPNLNQLAVALQSDHAVRASFATPLVNVDVTHLWVVVGAYTFVFLAAAIVLTWRRDVLH